ncbi:MAG: rhomboid family intramembrane serine protease [Taibaiella sp.]|nr:rhomboid family intramembrane serine protease [Taibaiella sp.]
MSYTLILLIITVLVSIAAFSNNDLYNRLILWPGKMDNPAEYHRLLSSGFIHADYGHLFFNMFTFYCFGKYVESIFSELGKHEIFLVLYLGGIIISSLPSFIKNRNNNYYRSLGASGGVAAVLFSFVYFAPWETIYIIIIPVPGILAGIGYLIYSAVMAKRGQGNVNHDAHLWGAVFGFFFALLIDPTHGRLFLEQLMQPHFNWK